MYFKKEKLNTCKFKGTPATLLRQDVAISGVVIFFVALVLLYIVFAGGTLAGFVITGSNQDANFVVFILGLAGLLVGAGMAFFGFAFRPPKSGADTALKES